MPTAGDAALGTDHVREGEGTTVRVRVDRADDVEHAVLALTPHRHLVGAAGPGSSTGPWTRGATALDLAVPVASLRWGRRRVGDGLVAATSAVGGVPVGAGAGAPRDR